MKASYKFTRYSKETTNGYASFEYGVNIEVEYDGHELHWSTSRCGGHGMLPYERDDALAALYRFFPRSLAREILDQLDLYLQVAADDLAETVGVVGNERVGWVGKESLGVKV